ncbi:unnamed protein product [Menidia menidia]|uniref:Thiamine transporter 2 n=1 Tax=Menidia menidia TaxID=238744 RepID=A0A8S4BSP1_9TELE|nr:unnamed protein product [Menidia menidia]
MGCRAEIKSGWVYPTALLSLYGFFANCRVAEPFLTPYLIGPHKNISEEALTNYLFPIWTYSYLAFLFPVFILTDFLRYKPLITVQGLFLVTNYVLLCFAPGLPAMTLLQVNYAVVTSTEVAYFSYIYSVIPVEKYQRATGYLRSAMLVGYTFGASLGQMLVSLAGVDYFYINVITLGIVSVAFLISFWLPMPSRSIFFKGKEAVGSQGRPCDEKGPEEAVMDEDGADLEEKNVRVSWCSRENVANAAHLLWKSFRESYSSRHFIFLNITLSAAAAFSVGFIKVSWAVWGELALGLFSAVGAGAVFVMVFTSSIWVCYAAYVIFKSSYMFLITITTFQIASNLSMECYALTFGINTFIALSLQTIITVIVVDESALGLDIVTQFIVYGSYYTCISLLFLIRGTYTACITYCRTEDKEATEQEPSRNRQKNMEVVKRWRSDWRYPTTLLCIYGFFSTVKPLEPFLIPYLTGPDKNFTTEQVNNQIFPVWTYSYLCVLLPVFLLTDWLRYKPVVVFQSVMLLITTALLRWTESVAAMQAMQFCYGVVTASEVAYFSYIYSVVDLKRYRRATSYSRSVQLLGYTVGSVLGQLLVSFHLMSYYNILVFTLVLTAMAFFTSCFLPMPKQSMFFHRKRPGQPATDETKGQTDAPVEAARHSRSNTSQEVMREERAEGRGTADNAERELKVEIHRESKSPESCSQVIRILWRDFRLCYSSRQLLYWSVWWAMATCGYNQTVNYVQVLWEHVQPSQNFSIYNGGVEAASNLLSAATAYGIGFTEVRWEQWGELALGGFSGLGAAALFLMTFAGNIWVCYGGYVIFKCLYMLLITIAMYQIAADLSMERYALVFGVNNFGALVLQTIITSVVVDSAGLGLAIIPQVRNLSCDNSSYIQATSPPSLWFFYFVDYSAFGERERENRTVTDREESMSCEEHRL